MTQTTERDCIGSTKANIRTINRDIKLLGENLYYAEIKICGGASRLAKVDVEDFAPPSNVLEVWQKTKAKKKPPQLSLFDDLETAIKLLVEERRRIYDQYTCDLQPYQVIPGSNLNAFMTAHDALMVLASEQLEQVLERHASAKTEWLENEIKPLLEAGYLNDEVTETRLAIYANRFPSFEKIQKKFGVQLKGPFRLQSFREALEVDAAARKALAEREKAEAELQQAKAEQAKAQTEITAAISAAYAADTEARQKVWAAEQEASSRAAVAAAAAAAEQEAYRRAYSYQEEQIKSAIQAKVDEMRGQVLRLLHKKLSTLVEKDYQPGKIPPGLKRDLETLAQNATLLSQTDQSLSEVVAGLELVNTHANSHSPHEDMRWQVDQLLANLEARLTPPDIDLEDEYLDRASWVNFDRPLAQVS